MGGGNTALINNLYIFVEDEELTRDIDSTTHPVESGIEIVSTIRRKPIEISLSGKIVDVGNLSAGDIINKISSLQKSGSLIKYSGRNVASDMQIQEFQTSHTNKIAGGADFSMTLREVRIAKSSYTPKAKKTQQTQKKTNPDLSVGAIVVFKGGNVYISSDAKNPAVKRGRSTCKITIINKRSWAIHPYHLISTDGGMVYGWVDKANIEGVPSSSTSAKTNAGTQQVQKGGGGSTTGSSGAGRSTVTSKASIALPKESTTKSTVEYTYYTVKKGDTVAKLVNVTFKDNGLTIKDILDANPLAFAVKGLVTSLKVGVRLRIPKKGSNYSRSHSGGGGKF
jgi:LysM repeat protein